MKVRVQIGRWAERAACLNRYRKQGDPFFTDPGERHTDERYAEARALCDSCEVSKQCKAYSEANGEKYGLWAGDLLEK